MLDADGRCQWPMAGGREGYDELAALPWECDFELVFGGKFVFIERQSKSEGWSDAVEKKGDWAWFWAEITLKEKKVPKNTDKSAVLSSVPVEIYGAGSLIVSTVNPTTASSYFERDCQHGESRR
ncbi:hypothetical protein [Aureliella helgolandensis]|uniref:hypothetical protein n=1 Tax=Aureliella helgolandensis TaxID=2527968 RepID=UPI0011A0E519|nr:hypothetical protein [Aureliella helgolandensis]